MSQRGKDEDGKRMTVDTRTRGGAISFLHEDLSQDEWNDVDEWMNGVTWPFST